MKPISLGWRPSTAHGGLQGGFGGSRTIVPKAIEIDPQLARAYVGLAYVYEYRLDFGLGTPADNLAKLMEAARNAVRLDPNDGETQLVLGHAFAYHGMADQALEQFAKAEALAPNNADLLILIAWFIPQFGQPDRASNLQRRRCSSIPTTLTGTIKGFGSYISLAASSINR